jgi:hypothetical protein
VFLPHWHNVCTDEHRDAHNPLKHDMIASRQDLSAVGPGLAVPYTHWQAIQNMACTQSAAGSVSSEGRCVTHLTVGLVVKAVAGQEGGNPVLITHTRLQAVPACVAVPTANPGSKGSHGGWSAGQLMSWTLHCNAVQRNAVQQLPTVHHSVGSARTTTASQECHFQSSKLHSWHFMMIMIACQQQTKQPPTPSQRHQRSARTRCLDAAA